MPYLLDSDVLIDVSRGKQPAREYLDALPEGWAISRVSALELIVGARDNRDLTAIDAFLSAFVVVPLRESTGTRALLKRYAKSHGLHVFDSLVAATAIEEGLTLVTRNRRHFSMIEGLSLLVPQYRCAAGLTCRLRQPARLLAARRLHTLSSSKTGEAKQRLPKTWMRATQSRSRLERR